MKNEAMAQFRADYAALKAQSGMAPARWTGFDAWVARANNAAFGAQAAYDDLVPGFETLFEREGRDWLKFYAAVRQLADLPKAERQAHFKRPPATPRA